MNKINLRSFLVASIAGFMLGFIILHPFSMLFQGMTYPTVNINPAVLADSFHPHHLAMAFFFGVLGLVTSCILLYFQAALSREKERVKLLEGFLPICSYCKKIRDDEGKESGTGDWVEIEQYIQQRSTADFTHGVCQECYEKVIKDIKTDEINLS